MFVGLVTGYVLQCTISEDTNKIEVVRRRQAHTHAVSGIVLSPNGKEVFTCGKDKHLVWASTETGLKTGWYFLLLLE